MSAMRANDVDTSFPSRDALRHLSERRAPYLVGGSHACQAHTGIHALAADLDIFVKEVDRGRVLDLLLERGYEAIVERPHWLTKARCGDAVIDVVYGSGNGVVSVDDLWFRHSVPAHVLGVEARLVPVEELLWSKAFMMDKYRFEGADVAHLLLVQAERINWDRLLWRFGRHWRVLLGHLLFFGYIYPEKRELVPRTLVDTLLVLLRNERDESVAGPADSLASGRPACRGTLLSRDQYRVDVDVWGFRDPRVEPDRSVAARGLSGWRPADEGEAVVGA
jgi:hypothetical protein